MPADLPLRCECGALRGVARGISPERGNHIVCYCDDCQSFAHFLGRADRILDPRGGTDIFQTSPARVELTEGREQLACIRLTGRGPLRWYAACCRTPIGNTPATRQVPFVGLIRACLDPASGGRARDDALGPVRAPVFPRFAKGGGAPPRAGRGALPRVFLQFVRLTLAARLRGDHRRSPFFDARSGAPAATPHVLSAEELRAVEAARDAWIAA
jgi:hypothetical protein